ncbi:hypothetical protein [Pseudomonas sp. KB-10]|uniref:hypothetical protein n=1 Tax=Pseudomonas sp. KB-10 TaxID=2292264 RepID=UPI001BAE6FB9|nr:hypothetical protein [Pseudomonas sp. KB-10]
MKKQGRLSRSSVGEFSASDWKSEGHSLLLFSKTLRIQWLLKRRRLIRRLREENFGTVGHLSVDLDLIQHDQALVKSSTLLIGYAIEMYLKAGLANSLIGCPEELFSCLSRKFSHDYTAIAEFIGFPTDRVILEDLSALSSAVQFDARYPISAANNEDYINKTNERRQRLADNTRYKRYRLLAKSLDHYTYKMLGSTKNPLSTGWVTSTEMVTSVTAWAAVYPQESPTS